MRMGASHLDLLAHARVIQRSALAGEVDALHAELCDLRNSLTEHLRGESEWLDGLSVAVAEVTRTGHRRLLEQVDRLIVGSEHDDRSCRCVEGTARLMQMLQRQARLESSLLAEDQRRA